jgi:hypothetical protein
MSPEALADLGSVILRMSALCAEELDLIEQIEEMSLDDINGYLMRFKTMITTFGDTYLACKVCVPAGLGVAEVIKSRDELNKFLRIQACYVIITKTILSTIRGTQDDTQDASQEGTDNQANKGGQN